MIGFPNKEWDYIPSPGIVFFQTSSQEVLQTEPIIDEIKESFLHNKCNDNVMSVGDTILAATAESGIDKNWCIFDNKSTCNAFINGKYLSNIINYICTEGTDSA